MLPRSSLLMGSSKRFVQLLVETISEEEEGKERNALIVAEDEETRALETVRGTHSMSRPASLTARLDALIRHATRPPSLSQTKQMTCSTESALDEKLPQVGLSHLSPFYSM